MTDQIDTFDIRNTTPVEGTVQDMRKLKTGLLKIVNTLDQDVTVEIESTTFDDEGFAKGIITHSLSVASGDDDYLVNTDAWSFLRTVSTASLSPTTGSLKLVWVFKTRA